MWARKASLEPVLDTVQGIHWNGIDHGYLALVVFEHKDQVDILHVELADRNKVQYEQQQNAAHTTENISKDDM